MTDEYVEDGIPFLRSQNVKPFRIDLADIKRIRPEFHARLAKSALCPGDVVIVRTGYPGIAAVIPRSLEIANCADLVVVTPTPEVDSWFLCSVLNSAWGRATVAGKLVGAAQQHFNVGAAKEMRIKLPPFDIQRRIASILSAYDDLIDNNMRRITILEEMARRVFEEWFVHFRFPGRERTRLVVTELDRIPADFEIATLGDVCARITDGAHKSPPSTEVGIPMASVKDMADWDFDLESVSKVMMPARGGGRGA